MGVKENGLENPMRVDGKTGFRRIGEQTISVVSPLPDTLEKYIALQFAGLYDLCHRYQIPIPPPTKSEDLHPPTEPLSAQAQRLLARWEHQKYKNSQRIKAAWITRRGVEQIMEENPSLDKTDALKLYLADHPRTRVDISIPTPETAKTSGQKSWVTRLQNIVDAAAAAGETMTWAEAHKVASERKVASARRARAG